jgi:DNA-binding transcriptional regulator YhcF (GntR family)
MAYIARTEPPYKQIAAYYRAMIEKGDLAAGKRLPSVSRIAHQWGVGLTTARKALRLLEQQGYVQTIEPGHRVRGNGV